MDGPLARRHRGGGGDAQDRGQVVCPVRSVLCPVFEPTNIANLGNTKHVAAQTTGIGFFDSFTFFFFSGVTNV